MTTDIPTIPTQREIEEKFRFCRTLVNADDDYLNWARQKAGDEAVERARAAALEIVKILDKNTTP